MISDIIENLLKNYQVDEIGDDDLSGKTFLISTTQYPLVILGLDFVS